MIATTSSILSRAIRSPSNIWALFLALSRSKRDLLKTTSFLCSIKSCRYSFKSRLLGRLLTTARKLIPKELSRAVCLYRLFITMSERIPFLRSITILIPFLSDSSLRSLIPSTFFSLTRAAIFFNNFDLFKAKGISVITKDSNPLDFCSVLNFALILILPRPELYASLRPLRPYI